MRRIIGVTGSRDLPESHANLVAACIADCDLVITGCAKGADKYARILHPIGAGLCVFKAEDYPCNGDVRASLAARSTALVKELARLQAQGNDVQLVGFPVHLAPLIKVCKSWQSTGSGTWSTIALAAGHGIPVHVYRYDTMLLPVWPGFIWVRSEQFPGAWYLAPQTTQQNLFGE